MTESECGVLIVDDEPEFARVMAELLRRHEFAHVFIATSGTEALSLLSSNDKLIDVLLLDQRMPEMDGFELISHLVNVHHRLIGVIMYTAFSTVDSVNRFYHTGNEIVRTERFLDKSNHHSSEVKAAILQVFDSVQRKRKAQAKPTERAVIEQRERLESSLAKRMSTLEEKVDRIDAKLPGFLAQLGLDVLRILLIGIAVLAFFLLDVDGFIKRILER